MKQFIFVLMLVVGMTFVSGCDEEGGTGTTGRKDASSAGSGCTVVTQLTVSPLVRQSLLMLLPELEKFMPNRWGMAVARPADVDVGGG